MIYSDERIKQFEPLWGNWYAEELIGEGGYGKVYRIVRNDTGGVYYSACKHITIPKNESEIANARAMGMDDRALYSFFESMAQKILTEIEIMYALRGEANIVAYEDHMIVNTPGILKWDIFIRMELLIPLTAYMRNNKLPPEEVRRLGIEICSALDACASYSIIHRDIKDANIFLNNRGIYKLGDFGIAKEMNVDSVSVGMRGTPAYVAPEVYDGRKYDSTVDIYSLGILLYKLLNRERYPFLPAAPAPFTPEDTEKAFAKRMAGEPIPAPVDGDDALRAAVLMACDYDPNGRFATARAMQAALRYMGV